MHGSLYFNPDTLELEAGESGVYPSLPNKFKASSRLCEFLSTTMKPNNSNERRKKQKEQTE